MRLCKETSYNVTHIIDPVYYEYLGLTYSFCGIVGQWPSREKIDCYEFFDGTSDQVNCGTCKIMANKYVLRKLKGEN